MRIRLSVLTGVSALTVLSALSTPAFAQFLFRADFEDGVVGMAPPSSPAGEPVGDTIVVRDSAPGSITVADGIAGMSGNAVLMDRSVGTGTFAVDCLPAPEAGEARVFELRWRSVALTQQFLLSVTIRAGAYLMGSVQFRREGEITFGSADNTLDVTWQQGIPQEFVLAVDLDKELTLLYVDGVQIPLPFSLSAAPEPIDRIGFEMGGQGLDDFAFDDVELEIVDAIVPARPSTWGALKERYDPR